jgi:hypothetical protein
MAFTLGPGLKTTVAYHSRWKKGENHTLFMALPNRYSYFLGQAIPTAMPEFGRKNG